MYFNDTGTYAHILNFKNAMDKMQFCNNAVITMHKNKLNYKKHVRSLKANSIELVLPEKVIGPELVKKFPAFYGNQRFITVFTSVRHLSLYWARSVRSSSSHFLKIHFSTILPSTPTTYKWCLPFRSPTKTPYAPIMSPIRAICTA